MKLVRICVQLTLLGWMVCVLQGSRTNCGGNLTGLHGRFQSPNYPQVYPDFAKCVWNLVVPKGYYIRLNFLQFEVEGIANCTYDYVDVRGNNGSLGRYCGTVHGLDGNYPRQPIKTSENEVSVVFQTDYSNEEDFHGFEAIFVAHDVDECKKDNGGCGQLCYNFIGGHYCACKLGYALGKDGRICVPQCQEMLLRSKTGVVQTPEYPNKYPPHADCDWTILSEAGYKIILEYDELDIESHPDYHCPYDYVIITMYGRNIEEEKVCGKRNATTVITSAVMIQYKFHSDDSLSKKGFRVRYRFQGIRCPAVKAPVNGGIQGPEKPEFKDIVKFHCNEKYRLVGKSELECTYDGTWDGDVPVCKLYSCGKPPVLDENTIFLAENYTINSTVYYGCKGVYYLEGEGNRTCRPDGTWTGITPTCKPVCGRTPINKDMSLCDNEQIHLSHANMHYSPWRVSVVIGRHVVCTGALVSEIWMVTAAHCITDPETGEIINERLVRIFIERNVNPRNSSQNSIARYRILQIIRHKDFFPAIYNSDIALLKFRGKVKMTINIRPICLPSNKRQRSLFLPGRRVLIAGLSSPLPRLNISQPKALQTCSFIVNRRTCNASFTKRVFKVTPLMLCTPNARNSNGQCIGYSGGLMTSYDDYSRRWILGGLTSWGNRRQCLHDYRVFTRINKFAKWLKSIVFAEEKSRFLPK